MVKRTENINYEAENNALKDKLYASAKRKQREDTLRSLTDALELFESIPGWRDADECVDDCLMRIAQKKREADEKKATHIIIKTVEINQNLSYNNRVVFYQLRG